MSAAIMNSVHHGLGGAGVAGFGQEDFPYRVEVVFAAAESGEQAVGLYDVGHFYLRLVA